MWVGGERERGGRESWKEGEEEEEGGKNCKSGEIEDRVAMDFCLMQFVNTTATHNGSGPADSLWVHRTRGIQQE